MSTTETPNVPTEAEIHMEIMDIMPIERVRPFDNYSDGFAVICREDWINPTRLEALEERTGLSVSSINITDNDSLRVYLR
jgi:hypothetical protein